MKKPDKKVYETYNNILEWFDANRNKKLVMEKFYLEFIQKHTPVSGTILDVGCGTSEPIAKFFIEHNYKVTGVDASQKMIELCKQRYPKEQWVLADMRTLDLEGKFDVVMAWHSLFHLPHEDQIRTLKLLAFYVKENGLLVFTSGPERGENWSENGGYELYHASFSSQEYEQILHENNLQILVHNIKDPNCGGATVWIAEKSHM